MKKYLLIALVFSIHFVSAQVGINTTAPQNTLDVNGSTRVRDMEEVTNPDDEKSKYVVTANENGVLTKVDKSTFNNLLSIKELSSVKKQNLSTDSKIYDVYLFDGGRDNTITLPKAKNGASIFFYDWGGSTGNETKYIFKGSANGKLATPSITNYPPGVMYRRGNANGRLVLTSPSGDQYAGRRDASFRFRYTKIEFICFGNSWYYVHNDPR